MQFNVNCPFGSCINATLRALFNSKFRLRKSLVLTIPILAGYYRLVLSISNQYIVSFAKRVGLTIKRLGNFYWNFERHCSCSKQGGITRGSLSKIQAVCYLADLSHLVAHGIFTLLRKSSIQAVLLRDHGAPRKISHQQLIWQFFRQLGSTFLQSLP